MLACFVLPQQAAAQNSFTIQGVTYTIANAVATEGGTAHFEITTEPGTTFSLITDVTYTAGSADLEDLGSDRPTTFSGSGQSSYTIEVPIAEDDTVEENETFTVQVNVVGNSPTTAIQATGTIIDNDGTPPPTVNINIAPASATEGDDIRFPVTLSTALLEARTINVGYTAGSGNTGAGLGDLGSDRPTTLTLPTGTTTVDLVVPTVDDTDDENNETFTVTLSLPDPPANPANTLTITTSSATGTINDNDETPDAEVSITNASVAENAAAGAIGFTVSLDRAVDSDVTLAVAYAAVTATLATDLGTRPTTVTIDQGQTEATLMVPVTDDDTVEGNETFTVTLSEGTTPLPDDVTIGADNEATGTITDADTAGVSLSSTAPPAGSEGGTITFTVNLDNPVAETFSLGWAATDGTATVEDDLDDQSGTVEIPANAETATFTIPVTNDTDIEDSEMFTVALTGAPTGLVNIAASRITVDRTSATGTINASDAPDVNTVTIGNRSVAENVSGGSVGFTVSLTRAVDSDVTLAVAYTAGTATLDDDLGTPLPPSVTITEGNTSATLRVPIANEVLVEGDETFTVTLSENSANPLPEGVEIGNGVATGTITNDDEAEIRTNVSEVNETGVSLTFRPGVTAPLAQDLALAWEVTGGTASAADFIQYVSSGTVTIPARQNSATILFFPRDDDLVEGNETLTLTFSPAPGTTLPDGVTFRRTTATATIRDSDEAVIDLRVVADVSETDARLTFRPVLSRRLTQDVTVSWEVTGGTASADDFSEYVGSGTVTIEAGRGGAPIRFFPLDDDAVEGDETLEVTISAALGTLPRGVNLGATTTATATIADSDEAPVVNATVGIDDASVAENGGNAEFTVSLTTAVNSAVVLDVIYEGSGDNPVELARDLGAGRPATVTIEEGRTEATLTVPVNNDALVEGDETFTVTIRERLANPLPDGVTIDDGTATGTIVDNETGQVTLGPPTLTAAEDGEFTYTVSLSRAADDAVIVRWTASAGPGDTATVDDDLREATGTVTFAARNNTAQEFTIRPVNDNDDEDNETFTVTLEVDTEGNNPLPTGITIGTTNSSTATITDNDEAPAVNATVSIDDESVAENVSGGTVTFTAALTTAVNSPVVLAVAVTAGTATLGVDLGMDLPTTVTIDANTTEATFTVPITDDTIVEGNETFTVTLSESGTTDLPEGVIIRDGIATGTITENDAGEVTLAPAEATAAEGGEFTYTVSLSAASDEAVTVRWTATAGPGDTATVGDDLQATTDTVTFAANDNMAQEFTISPVDDDAVEGNETFTVTLEVDTQGGNPLPTGITIGSSNSSTATITDNDEAPPPTVPAVEIGIAAASATEGDNIRFTVMLSEELPAPRTLNIGYAAGTGDSGADLGDLGADRPTTLSLPAGVRTVNLDVPTVDDGTVEEDETFTVTISAAAEQPDNPETVPPPSDVTLLFPNGGVATGTIVDNDDAPRPVNATVSIADADPVAEGAGPARFTVSLSRAADSDVVLDVAYAAGTASLADLGSPRPDTVTIKTGATEAAFAVPIFDDDIVEGEEAFTVTLTVNTAPEGVTVADGVATGTIARTPEPSILIEPRRIAAGTALRRHVSRFDSLTGTVARSRLEARETRRLSGSKDLGDGAVAVGGGLGESRWGAWIDGAWAGFDGTASGRQADVYGGVDYLAPGSDWLIGALIGHEVADLEIGEATYRSDYTHLGLYGGARLSERLLFDGAVTYGTATPDIALGDVSASYDARRITARGALTGDFGLEYGLWTGSVKVQPRLGVLYSRERLGAFTDSAGGVAEREILELGRFSAGPRLTWDFDGVRVAGGARVQGDFRGLDDGTGGRLSGAADIGVNLDLTPNVTLGAQGDVDGIGVSDEFGSLGGKVELGVRF